MQPLDWTQVLGKLTAGCEALLCNPWIGLRLLENSPLDVRLCYATLGLDSGSWKTHRWILENFPGQFGRGGDGSSLMESSYLG